MNHRPIQIILPESQTEMVLRDCLMASYDTKVDQLDCSKSVARQKTDKTVEEILQMGLNYDHTLYSFIYKDMSFLPQEYPKNHDYWDVGLSTLTSDVSYYLWIRLFVQDGWAIASEYDLKERKF